MIAIVLLLVGVYVFLRLIGMVGNRLDNDRHHPRPKRVYYPKWWTQEQIDEKMRDIVERESRKPWWLK
jgi:hypothetical protein